MPTLDIGKALLRRRSDGKYLVLQSAAWEERPERSQKPDLPGGTVEVGETPSQGCAREIQEEAGITVAPEDLQLVYAMTFQSPTDGVSINRLIYMADIDDVSVELSWEHEAFWWASADELLAMEIREPYGAIFQYLSKAELLT